MRTRTFRFVRVHFLLQKQQFPNNEYSCLVHLLGNVHFFPASKFFGSQVQILETRSEFGNLAYSQRGAQRHCVGLEGAGVYLGAEVGVGLNQVDPALLPELRAMLSASPSTRPTAAAFAASAYFASDAQLRTLRGLEELLQVTVTDSRSSDVLVKVDIEF